MKTKEILKHIKENSSTFQKEVLNDVFSYFTTEIENAISKGYQIQYMKSCVGYFGSCDGVAKKWRLVPMRCRKKIIDIGNWSIEKEFEGYSKETSTLCIHAIVPIYCTSENKLCEIYFDIADMSKAKETDFVDVEDKEPICGRPIEGGSQPGGNPPPEYFRRY